MTTLPLEPFSSGFDVMPVTLQLSTSFFTASPPQNASGRLKMDNFQTDQTFTLNANSNLTADSDPVPLEKMFFPLLP